MGSNNVTTKEEWKDLDGYEYSFTALGKIYRRPLYRISSFGRIMSDHGQGYKQMTTQVSNYGQSIIMLTGKDSSGKATVEMVGLLVARHFVPNPHGYSHIEFKDGNPLNCRADNIIWTNLTEKQRAQYKSFCKRVNRYSPEGVFLDTYESIVEAAEKMNGNNSSIANACKKYTKAYNCFWRFANEFPEGENIEIIEPWKQSYFQLDKKTQEIIRRFESIQAIAVFLEKEAAAIQANINNCCKGKRPSAYGYSWKFETVKE
jgi:hypothetical protein